MKARTMASLVMTLVCFSIGGAACGGEPTKDPETCKTEGKESGDKCKACCTAAGKSGHSWVQDECSCF